MVEQSAMMKQPEPEPETRSVFNRPLPKRQCIHEYYLEDHGDPDAECRHCGERRER